MLIDRIPRYLVTRLLREQYQVPVSSFDYHHRGGHIPKGEREGGRWYFSPKEVRQIIGFFRDRTRWEHVRRNGTPA